MLSLLITVVAACSSSSDTPGCSFDNPPAFASESPWPRFRANLQNTGSVVNAAATENSGQLRWVFPPLREPAKGGFVASPVLNNDGTLLYIGSNDGWMYAIDAATGGESAFNLATSQPITSSAMLGVRNGVDAIFFGGGDGRLYAVDASAAILAGFPYPVGNYVAATPVLFTADGTVYGASEDGTLLAMCPNGYPRFARTIGGTSSSPAIGPEGILYFGTDAGHQLRALRYDNVPQWTFTASGSIPGAPVAEVDGGATTAIYFGDRGGRVFKVDAGGQMADGFTVFGPVGPISSSPALAAGRLYVASEDGNLYALNATTGAEVWRQPFAAGGAIRSSPAVATGGTEPLIVVGADDGLLYFVRDEGDVPRLDATFEIGLPVRSSPAIGSDGTVYVGGQDGRVYALR